MKTIAVVGLNLAKSVFQIHAIDADSKVVVRRQLRHGEVLKFFGVLSPCLVGMEACASAHHWARELVARGHELRLMPPATLGPEHVDGAGERILIKHLLHQRGGGNP